MARLLVERRPVRGAELALRKRWAGTRGALKADVVGLLLLCAAAVWTFISALVQRSDPLAALTLLAMLAAGTIAGRLAPTATPAVILGSAALLLIVDPLGFISREGGGAPFGYQNAKGAYLVQAAAAGIIVARSGWPRFRSPALVGAFVFALTPFAFGSVAAGILGVTVVGLSIVTQRVTRAVARLVALGLAVALLATVVSTIVLGDAYSGQHESGFLGSVDTALSERRRLLWGDAIDALEGDPLFGAGPGNFERTSALARQEEDVRWVPSVFLEGGAEGGIPGLTLLLVIALWSLGRLIVGRRPAWLIVTGAAATFAVGLNASMDYILHYPVVPLVAGVIFGSATSITRERNR